MELPHDEESGKLSAVGSQDCHETATGEIYVETLGISNAKRLAQKSAFQIMSRMSSSYSSKLAPK